MSVRDNGAEGEAERIPKARTSVAAVTSESVAAAPWGEAVSPVGSGVAPVSIMMPHGRPLRLPTTPVVEQVGQVG